MYANGIAVFHDPYAPFLNRDISMSDDRIREPDMSRPDEANKSNSLDKSKPSSPLQSTIDSTSLPSSDETLKHVLHSASPKSGPLAAPSTTAFSGTDQTIQLYQSAQTKRNVETKDTAHYGVGSIVLAQRELRIVR